MCFLLSIPLFPNANSTSVETPGDGQELQEGAAALAVGLGRLLQH